MPKLEPIDEQFFATAPYRARQSWEIDKPAAAVWDELTGENPLHWCRILKIRWTSAAPRGVGATRHVGIVGLIQADEHYFIWDEGRRNAFYFSEVNLPLLKRFGELYEVEPTGERNCRFTWTLAYEPSALGRPGVPVNTLLFKSLFADTTRYYGGRRSG